MFSPELVLIDAHIPILDGIQATRYIKRHQHPPRVIIITSDDSPALKAAAELAGADGFVRTDLNLRQQMIDTLRKVFAPPGDTPSAANEEPHARSATFDEKSENEKSPIMNHRSRCARWRIATSPRKNQPAAGTTYAAYRCAKRMD
jgi:DNA-binding NarL/FixJ family response regulator